MTVQREPAAIESVDDFFGKQGPLPSKYDDSRRFPRFYFRTCAEALIYPAAGKQAPPSAHCFVLTCDLSRSGISLLHNAQLFPGQRIDIILNGEPPRLIEVVWCRRVADGRYSVGCRFCKAQGKPA
jgi:PilZ domain